MRWEIIRLGKVKLRVFILLDSLAVLIKIFVVFVRIPEKSHTDSGVIRTGRKGETLIKNKDRILFKKWKKAHEAGQTGIQTISSEVFLIQNADLDYDPNEYHNFLKPNIDDRAVVVYGSRFFGVEPKFILHWNMVANK